MKRILNNKLVAIILAPLFVTILGTLVASWVQNVNWFDLLLSVGRAIRSVIVFKLQIPVYLLVLLMGTPILILYIIARLSMKKDEPITTDQTKIIELENEYKSEVFNGVKYSWSFQGGQILFHPPLCANCDEVIHFSSCVNCRRYFSNIIGGDELKLRIWNEFRKKAKERGIKLD